MDTLNSLIRLLRVIGSSLGIHVPKNFEKFITIFLNLHNVTFRDFGMFASSLGALLRLVHDFTEPAKS